MPFECTAADLLRIHNTSHKENRKRDPYSFKIMGTVANLEGNGEIFWKIGNGRLDEQHQLLSLIVTAAASDISCWRLCARSSHEKIHRHSR